MIKIYRYSNDGFISKIQTYHYNYFLEIPNFEGLNEYQKGLALESYNRLRPIFDKLNLDDWKEGIFVFIGGLPEQCWINHELNHLDYHERIRRKLYEASIPDYTDVYSVYNLSPEMYTAEEYILKFWSGAVCYIPKRSLMGVKYDI